MKKKVKGTMTIEVAFLVPFIFIVIITCIFLAFHLYNANIAFDNTYATLLKNANSQSLTVQEKFDAVKDDFQNKCVDRMIAVQDATTKLSAGAIVISMEYTFTTDCPFFETVDQGIFNASGSISISSQNPVELLYTCRLAKELIKNEKEGENE